MFTNQSIHGYTLLKKIGEGGMAEVWVAQNSIGKKAAVKILLPAFIYMPQVLERFANEAKIMVSLEHPNIRQVFDYAAIDDRPCIIMEHLEGADLSTRLKRGECFKSEQLKEWWNQIASALNYTHRKEVVHRDIKPSNIFLCEDGQIKLLDFGIAKIRSSITITQTGSRMGTLMYMSPEQVKDSKNLDYRTDLYSLAVSFVHLLSGHVPYDNTKSSEFDIQLKIVSEPLTTDKLSADWHSFLFPYLNKEPELRPSLTNFKEEPQQFSKNCSVPSSSSSKTELTLHETKCLSHNLQQEAKPSDSHVQIKKMSLADKLAENKKNYVSKSSKNNKNELPVTSVRKKKNVIFFIWFILTILLITVSMIIWQPWKNISNNEQYGDDKYVNSANKSDSDLKKEAEEKEKLKIRNNWQNYIYVERSDYEYRRIGGIFGLSITVKNTSKYTIDYMHVEIVYCNPYGESIMSQEASFYNIEPYGFQITQVADTKRGVSIKYFVKKVYSSEIGLTGSDSEYRE